MGGLQVVLTAALITLLVGMMGLTWPQAAAIGLALSLSSTAIVLQSLNERGLTQSEGGQSSFSILLFQDIAVIPILALLPILADTTASSSSAETATGFAALAGWLQALITLGVIAGVIIGSRLILRPVFRAVAATGIRELFTATALFVVVGISVLMTMIHISPALGTFIGGVVLADSEYRHELESDLEPFKGLLLGLFFITVGAGIDFSLFAADPALITGLVIGLMTLKMALIYGLGTLWKVSVPHRWTMSLGLGQGGEFAFVLLSVIAAHQILPDDIARLVTLVVAMSMALTPLVFLLNDRVVQPRFQGRGEAREADDPSSGHGKPVVIAGFGRYGQLAGRLLKANGFEATILDLDVRSIDTLRKHGLEVYYGDAARHDLLEVAGCGSSQVLIIAVDDEERILHIAELARRHFPELHIIARAKNPRHAFALTEAGVNETICEAEQGGIGLGEQALMALGFGPWRAKRAAKRFRRHQAETQAMLVEQWGDDKALMTIQRNRVADLEQLLESDEEDSRLQIDTAWKTGLVQKKPWRAINNLVSDCPVFGELYVASHHCRIRLVQ